MSKSKRHKGYESPVEHIDSQSIHVINLPPEYNHILHLLNDYNCSNFNALTHYQININNQTYYVLQEHVHNFLDDQLNESPESSEYENDSSGWDSDDEPPLSGVGGTIVSY